MIRQIYQNSWSSSSSSDDDDDGGGDMLLDDGYDFANVEEMPSPYTYTFYMINDIKINSYRNCKIRVHLSMIDTYGNKTYRLAQNDIYFNVYVQAFNRNEKILHHLKELQCFNDTSKENIVHKNRLVKYIK